MKVFLPSFIILFNLSFFVFIIIVIKNKIILILNVSYTINTIS